MTISYNRSVYPSATVAALRPVLWLDSFFESVDPESLQETPTNIGNVFNGAGNVVATNANVSEQAVLQSRGGGWYADGTDHWLCNDRFDFLQKTNEWTVAFEYKYDPTDQIQHTLLGNQLGLNGSGWSFQIDHRNGDADVRMVGNGIPTWVGVDPADGGFHVYEFIATGTDVELFIDGTSYGTKTIVPVATDAESNLYIFASNGPANRALGYMKKMLIADSSNGSIYGEF